MPLVIVALVAVLVALVAMILVVFVSLVLGAALVAMVTVTMVSIVTLKQNSSLHGTLTGIRTLSKKKHCKTIFVENMFTKTCFEQMVSVIARSQASRIFLFFTSIKNHFNASMFLILFVHTSENGTCICTFEFRHSIYLLVALPMGAILLSVVSVALFVVFASLVALVSILGGAVAAIRMVFLSVLLIMVVFLVMSVTCKIN